SGPNHARAPYHRALAAFYLVMMHKENQVYVNNMIAKFKTEEEHLVHIDLNFFGHHIMEK
ncbi:hypothetical protein PSZ46_23500, partial [Shigella flexneri]|nr:hypothetical protein [Shigella flexneri]